MGTGRSGRGSRRGDHAPGDPTAELGAGTRVGRARWEAGKRRPAYPGRAQCRCRPRPGRVPKGAEAGSPGQRAASSSTPLTRAETLVAPHRPQHASNPLSKEDSKKNVFRTWGRAALETVGLIPPEKSVQAGSSLTPSRPAPTAHVPTSKTRLQAGSALNTSGPPGVMRALRSLCPKLRAEREGTAPPALGC